MPTTFGGRVADNSAYVPGMKGSVLRGKRKGGRKSRKGGRY